MTIETSQTDIRNLSHEELVEFFKSIGEKSFRATQIFDWIYHKGVEDFEKMVNLPVELRSKLKVKFNFTEPDVIEHKISKDGTTKFLFQLKDKEKIETVFIPTDDRGTICMSTQAGCKFGCKFCASGIGGWTRNLTSSEILSQILFVKKNIKDKPLTNIVFMGVGEPLDNYDNLLKAIRIINAEKGIHLGARKITISTCGVVPKILKLAQEGLQIELAISLHGSSNDSRNVLMPVNKKYPVADLIEACREYQKATKRQITFEYILIKDVTCTKKAALELSQLLKGLLCKINLIPYNPVAEFGHKTPSLEEIKEFEHQLRNFGILCTVRTPRGRDVGAACGQLRHSSK